MKSRSFVLILATIGIISISGLAAVFWSWTAGADTLATDPLLLLLIWGLVGAALAVMLLVAYRGWTQAERLESALRTKTAELAQSEQRYRRLAQAPQEETTEGKMAEEALRHSMARAESLVRTAARLNKQVDHQAALDTICEEAARMLNVPSATICLYNEEKRQFEIAANVGLPAKFVRRARPLPLDWFRKYAGEARQPVVVHDLRQARQSPVSRLLLLFDFRTVAVVELHYRQRMLGILIVSVFEKTHVFSEEDLTMLSGFAGQAAQAITNARLFTTTRLLLRRTQQQWRQMQRIMETVPDGLVLLNAHHRVVLANPAGKQALSHLTDLQGASTLHKLGGQAIEQLLLQTGEGKPWLEVQAGPALQAGDEHIFEVTARPIGIQSGSTGSVLVIRDVTEERRRREYVQSQDRLATVGQLAAGIAHDFNNIMAIITLYSQSLERNPDLPKRREYLATIGEQARHASDLITQILDFSRRAIMERGPLDLLPFVKEVVKLLQRTLPENISINLRAEAGEYKVSADPTRLQQVLMNLALNARDAMPDGGELQISLSAFALNTGEHAPLPDMAPGQYMCLSVADNGTGINPEHLAHLFEPFFTTRGPGTGTGLGLAQVYGIVRQHGGSIEVDSSPGQGARFTIYLPALDTSPAAPREIRNTKAFHADGPATILLVEDHEPTREAIDDTLEFLGYRVLLAATGREALAVFDEHQGTVDLVLSDMVMPEMGGVDLYHKLMARDPDVKMVVMTGYPLENQGRSLLEQGIVAWLHKPFSPDVLGAKLREVLGGNGG